MNNIFANKVFASIAASLAVILVGLAGVILSLQGETTETLGASTGPSITRTASTSGTYFDVTGASTRTATATLLTLDNVYQHEFVGLEVNVWATTSIANIGTVFIQPQTSYDAIVWADWNPQNVGTGGSVVQRVTLSGASTTVLAWVPGELGTTTTQFVFENPIGNYMRFKVWTTGTSSILLKGVLQN